jgi:hypothetical protein
MWGMAEHLSTQGAQHVLGSVGYMSVCLEYNDIPHKLVGM